jgi:hypothetical protein
MKELLLSEEKGFELATGTTLVNNKYTIMGKIGTGIHSNLYAVSTIKGHKQVIRALKVVRLSACRKAHLSRNPK